MSIKVISPATYSNETFEKSCHYLIDSSKSNNVNVHFYDMGNKFECFYDSKIVKLLKLLISIDDEIVCIMDSSDTIINENINEYEETIRNKLKDCDVIISGESNCYPYEGFKGFYEAKKYSWYQNFRYVNSGFYVGRRDVIIDCLKKAIYYHEYRNYPNNNCDQFIWSYLFLFDDCRICLDDSLLCLNMFGIKFPELHIIDKKVHYNGIKPFMIHFNGISKFNMDELMQQIYGTSTDNGGLIKIDKNGITNLARFSKFDVWILNHVHEFYKDIPEGKNVIDAGGHVGYFSLLYKKKYPNSNVFMIEPYEENYNLAIRNFSNNNVVINSFKAALCGNTEYKYINVIESYNLGRVATSNKISNILVDSNININTLLDDKEDIVLKIDVEGAEWYILKDITENNFKKIKYITGEWNHFLDYFEKGRKPIVEEFIKLLRGEFNVDIKGNYFKAKRKNDMKIWKAHALAFGDMWGHTNRILKSPDEVIYIDISHCNHDKIEKIKNIVDVLDHKKNVQYVNKDYFSEVTRIKDEGVVEMQVQYLPTKTIWKYDKNKKYDICYQFETSANSISYLPGKILSKEMKDDFYKLFERYKVIELGLPQSINESIDIMLNSKAFVGICSGMSHVAHSVGIPIFLKEYDITAPKNLSWHYLDLFHANKYFSSFRDYNEFVMKFNGYMRLTESQKIDWRNSSIFRKGWSDRIPYDI